MNVTDGADVNLQLSPLHTALVKYATTFSRLLFIHNDSVFEDFENNTNFDLSTLELRSTLLNEVLPKVNNYYWPATVVKQLKLLDLHPYFRKTPNGYQYEPQHQNALCVLRPISDFSYTEKLLSLQKKRSNSESHTMLVAHDAVRSLPKYQLSLDIASLLSAMLSTDLELSSTQLHSLPEVQKRLRKAKVSFAKTGNLLPYRSDAELLINYIKLSDMMKTKLCRTLGRL